MGLITNAIQHLLGGVSKQPAEIRYPWQAEEQTNWLPIPVRGLERRPPLEWVASISPAIASNSFVKIVRIQNTDYLLRVASTGDVVLSALDGTPQTVNVGLSIDTAYLPSVSPKDDIDALVVGDTILLSNASVTVAETTTTDLVTNHNYTTHEGLKGLSGLTVVVGENTMTYKFDIIDILDSGNESTSKQTISYTSPASNAAIDTIVAGIVSAVNGTTWTSARAKKAVAAGNSVAILDTDGKDFRVSISGANDADSYVAFNRETAIDIGKLPSIWYEGSYCKAKVGASTSQKTEVWLRAVYDDSANPTPDPVPVLNVGTYASPKSPRPVRWVEAASPRSRAILDPTTLPIRLYKTGVNTWALSKGIWDTPKAGDATNNKVPSISGKKVTSLAVFRNRLALISPTSVVLSQNGQFWNLYRSTVATLLDEDRIDVAIAYTNTVDVRRALILNENLLLIGSDAQFLLRGSDVLTPTTAQASLVSNYDVNTDCAPAAVGRRVVFTTKSGNGLLVRALVASLDRDIYVPEEIGSHVPGYLSLGVTQIEHADAFGMSLFYAPGATELFVNNWVYDERQGRSAQNAFHKWTVRRPILRAQVVDNYVYVIGTNNLQRFDLTQDVTDGSLGYRIHLDERDNVSRLSYDATLDRSTFMPAYDVSTGIKAVSLATGELLDIVDTPNPSTIVVAGNVTDIVVGYIMPSTYTFGEFVVQRKDAAGALTPLFGGRLQMRSVSVLFSGLGYLKGITSLPGRDPMVTAAYVQAGTAASLSTVGVANISSGKIPVPILGNSKEARVQLVNDSYLPCTLISGEWLGYWHERSRRI